MRRPRQYTAWLRYWRDTSTSGMLRLQEGADNQLKGTITNFSRRQFVEHYKLAKIAFELDPKEGKTPPKTAPVTVALVTNILHALRGMCAVRDDIDAPAWLDGATGPDPRFLLAASNGLYDMEAAAAGRSNLHEPDPDLFNLTAVDYNVTLGTSQPTKWLAFLRQLWPDDPQTIDCLRQWFGYALSGDTSRQKMLWLIGPSRAGKGVIGHVLTKLVGVANVATPGLQDLASDFGLQSLLGKSLALIGDGRLSNRADAVLATARLLQIVGEDGIDVNRKGQPILENVYLGCRMMIAANELPAGGPGGGTEPVARDPVHAIVCRARGT